MRKGLVGVAVLVGILAVSVMGATTTVSNDLPLLQQFQKVSITIGFMQAKLQAKRVELDTLQTSIAADEAQLQKLVQASNMLVKQMRVGKTGGLVSGSSSAMTKVEDKVTTTNGVVGK